MPPALTGCPPNTLMPRRLDSESRPFLVEPAPFLCAASITSPDVWTRAGWGATTRVLQPRPRKLLLRRPAADEEASIMALLLNAAAVGSHLARAAHRCCCRCSLATRACVWCPTGLCPHLHRCHPCVWGLMGCKAGGAHPNAGPIACSHRGAPHSSSHACRARPALRAGGFQITHAIRRFNNPNLIPLTCACHASWCAQTARTSNKRRAHALLFRLAACSLLCRAPPCARRGAQDLGDRPHNASHTPSNSSRRCSALLRASTTGAHPPVRRTHAGQQSRSCDGATRRDHSSGAAPGLHQQPRQARV
jgi:hypothetical protein